MADLVEDLGLREVSMYTKKIYTTILKVKDSPPEPIKYCSGGGNGQG